MQASISHLAVKCNPIWVASKRCVGNHTTKRPTSFTRTRYQHSTNYSISVFSYHFVGNQREAGGWWDFGSVLTDAVARRRQRSHAVCRPRLTASVRTLLQLSQTDRASIAYITSTQMYQKLHLKRLPTGEWPWRSAGQSRSSEMTVSRLVR